MTDSWHFRDEWLLKAFAGVKGLTPELLAQFRAEKKKYFSHALIDSGVIDQEQFIKAAEIALKARYFPLAAEKVDKFALSLVPEKICRKYDLVPVKLAESDIQVAMLNPADMNAHADLEAVTGRRIVPLFSLPREIEACLDQLFSADTVIFDLLSKVDAPEEIMALGDAANDESKDASVTSPVIKLVTP